MVKCQLRKYLLGTLVIALFWPEPALNATAFPRGLFDAREPVTNFEPPNLLTKVSSYGGNKLLYLRHGYSFGGNGTYCCRYDDNSYNRTHRYCGDADSHYKHYSWAYIGLGLGFLHELGTRPHGSDRDGHLLACQGRDPAAGNRNISKRPLRSR